MLSVFLETIPVSKKPVYPEVQFSESLIKLRNNLLIRNEKLPLITYFDPYIYDF